MLRALGTLAASLWAGAFISDGTKARAAHLLKGRLHMSSVVLFCKGGNKITLLWCKGNEFIFNPDQQSLGPVCR